MYTVMLSLQLCFLCLDLFLASLVGLIAINRLAKRYHWSCYSQKTAKNKQANKKKQKNKETKKQHRNKRKTASKNTHCHPGRKNLQSVHHQFVRSKDSRHGAAQLDATAEHGIGLGSHVTQQKHMENGKKTI